MAENTWPGGVRRALTQSQHQQWNATHYPGTRQLCEICGEPTGKTEDCEPICYRCYLEEAAVDNDAIGRAESLKDLKEDR